MRTIAGKKAAPASTVSVAEHVLEELLADEHRAHERAEDDDPGAGRDPEDPPAGDLEVVERVRGTTLLPHEGRRSRERDDGQAQTRVPLPGTGAKLIESTRPATSRTERMPPRLSTGSVDSLTCAGTNIQAITSAMTAKRQGDEEDRAPPEVLQQPAGDQRTQRRDGSAEGGPQGDRLGPPGPGPQSGDQSQRGRVGHAGREPAEDPGHHQHVVGPGVGGEQAGGHRQQGAEHHQQLAAVPVTDGSQVEHGRGQAQRVADRDQVEAGLGGVERVADRRQGDVGHRQVEVGDPGHQDQGAEHQGSPLGASVDSMPSGVWVWDIATSGDRTGLGCLGEATKRGPPTPSPLRVNSRCDRLGTKADRRYAEPGSFRVRAMSLATAASLRLPWLEMRRR